jgi:hypothetical protein
MTPFKTCPTHLPTPVELPFTEFGVSRARADGRNLYCRGCIRRKVTESRRALKEYRAARKLNTTRPVTKAAPLIGNPNSPVNQARVLVELPPEERVRRVIANGARTWGKIAKASGLDEDAMGIALATLLLWTREIKTRTVDDTRHYFINNEEQWSEVRGQRLEGPELPQRRPDSQSFSALEGLMPGKRKVG